MLVLLLVHHSESSCSRSKFHIFRAIGTLNEEDAPKPTPGRGSLTLIVLMTTIVNVLWVESILKMIGFKWLIFDILFYH